MNTMGRHFRVTLAGESHGPCLTAIVDGVPAGVPLSVADIQVELDRRKPGQVKTTTRVEADQVNILSGVFEGKTTGAPIALTIPNQDARAKDYEPLRSVCRPGHADYTYEKKYGHRDHRGGGRASARLTALYVAAGAIAKKCLRLLTAVDIQVGVCRVGDVVADTFDIAQVDRNDYRFLDATKVSSLDRLFEQLRADKDSIGAQIHVRASGVPVGLGEPLCDKLSARLAACMMSINAVKAVELGDGVQSAMQRGSVHRDEMTPDGFLSNHAGGVLGGLSTGAPIEMTITFKPTSSIAQAAQTVTATGEAVSVSVTGRHDPCVALRAVPIVEAMMALVLIDFVLIAQASAPVESAVTVASDIDALLTA